MITSACEDHPLGQHEVTVPTPTFQGIKRTHDDAFEEQELQRLDAAAPPSNYAIGELEDRDDLSSYGIGESDHEDDAPSNCGIAESVRFKDAVLANPTFLQTLTSQEIIRMKYVCRGWKADAADGITISNARRQDESHDWYFPIFNIVNLTLQRGSSPLISPMLLGMWHGSEDFSSTSQLRNLPHVSYLPPPTLQTSHDCVCRAYRRSREYVLMASSGGLLLLQTVTALMHSEGSQIISNTHGPHCILGNDTWPSLMVTNPLTKQFQVLPEFIDEPHQRTEWHGRTQFLMMVDEIANSYKVLGYRCLLLNQVRLQQLVVYDSKSMAWENVGLNHHAPIQPPFGCWRMPSPREELYTTLCTRGRLYLADIRKPTATGCVMGHAGGGVVRVFQVDTETGQQILLIEFPIHKSHVQAVQVPELANWQVNTSVMLRNLELVECMGHLFAVIPARLDEFLYQPDLFRENMWENVDKMSLTYMPLQFYIFQLEGDIGVEGHGVLRIRHPISRKNCMQLGRRRILVSHMLNSRDGRDGPPHPHRNWFACRGRGNIIWVTVADYLLQYNVLSGESHTEMLPTIAQITLPGQIPMEGKVGVSYRASFHMQP